MSFLIPWMAFSLSVFIVAKILPSVHIRSLWTAVGVAALYGVLKFFLWWALVLLSLPFILMSFGLFLIVLNALLLWITDKLVEGFEIDSFAQTVLASLLITLIDVVLRWLLEGI